MGLGWGFGLWLWLGLGLGLARVRLPVLLLLLLLQLLLLLLARRLPAAGEPALVAADVRWAVVLGAGANAPAVVNVAARRC